ncbi:hypothetical protein HHK36_005522 [Tetracentron sinense]|uniref:Terpene synthase metal-binding domain-containing protein n=1 Tax=Tetracentron sinense TaxID=13715 RepID=A0A834ZUB9_TETSI|nr:hypothetical protein HHK36_005522 [Tetracentron sinense]
MALRLLPLTPPSTITRYQPSKHVPVKNPSNARVTRHIPKSQVSGPPLVRRSGNYQPCIWEYDYVQSLTSHYANYILPGETYTKRAEKLKGDVRIMFESTVEPLAQLELIDVLQRLGLTLKHIDSLQLLNHIVTCTITKNLKFFYQCLTKSLFLIFLFKWWTDLGLGKKLDFARDRLMENFLWTVGVIFEPQFGYCWRMSTKVNALIMTIDDVYDVYGTLDELELFTDAVERWDVNAMEQLPDYMKICFLALYNSVNEMAYVVLKEQGSDIVSYLKKAWADICKTYLLEAKWYHSGYTPTLEEYLNNAWISISAPVILVHSYFFVTNPITKEALECLESYPNIIRWSSMILRLCDDLGTSTDELKRGDVPKSIQCYMNETSASEEEAREHIRGLISDTWKKMNEDRVADSPFSQTFIGIAMNLARMAQCMYQYGDGHGIQDRETKDRVLALLVEPIPLSLQHI